MSSSALELTHQPANVLLASDACHFFGPPKTASGTTARAAFAQSTSFCTAGTPLTTIAPTTSPSTLMGKPAPDTAIRARGGPQAKSDGSTLLKLTKSTVARP